MSRFAFGLVLAGVATAMSGSATPAEARECRERLVDHRGRAYWGPGLNCDQEGRYRGYAPNEVRCRERLVDHRGRAYWGPGLNCDQERCRRRLIDERGRAYWGPGLNCDQED